MLRVQRGKTSKCCTPVFDGQPVEVNVVPMQKCETYKEEGQGETDTLVPKVKHEEPERDNDRKKKRSLFLLSHPSSVPNWTRLPNVGTFLFQITLHVMGETTPDTRGSWNAKQSAKRWCARSRGTVRLRQLPGDGGWWVYIYPVT